MFVDGQPLKLTLELTADCNLYCRMCEFPVPRERGRGRYDMDMPLETFRMLVPQVFPHARIVNLTVVGEPLMVPYLDEVLAECRNWQTKLELITNGMLLDRKMIERVGPETACMIISFDGGTRRTFNRIRIGGDFNVITRNMWLFHRWRSKRPPETWPGFHMAVTLMRENIEELPRHGGDRAPAPRRQALRCVDDRVQRQARDAPRCSSTARSRTSACAPRRSARPSSESRSSSRWSSPTSPRPRSRPP